MVAVLSNLEISTRVTKSLFSQTQDSMMEAWCIEERVWPNLFPIDFGIWAAEAKVRSSLKSWMIHIFENNFTSLQTPFNSPLAHFHTSIFCFKSRGLLWNYIPQTGVSVPHLHMTYTCSNHIIVVHSTAHRLPWEHGLSIPFQFSSLSNSSNPWQTPP